jgi:TRAP-type C4-dicarboxylate transport system substrate-binding protein
MIRVRPGRIAAIALAALVPTAGALAQSPGPSIGPDPGLPADLPAITFRLAHNAGPGTPTELEAQEVARRITARSGGAITFELFPGSQLGAVQDVVAQVAEGAPIISNGEPSLYATYGAPDMGILTGPFLIDSPDQWPTLVRSDLVKGWEEAIAADGNLRVLDLGWYVGERHLIGNAAYPEPADLAGVKIRIPPLPAWTTTFEAVGATPVTVDFTEVYTALSQGVVDASEAPLSAINGARWQEVAKQITETGHFRQFQGFVMAESVFAALPAEHQRILLEEFQAGGERATATEIASAETLRGEFEAQGVTFSPANVEAYRAATAPFYEAYPEWTPGLLEQVNGVLGR